MQKVFLEAKWEDLIMVNYEVSQELLLPYLPKNTELDLKNGICYVSLIGFMFKNTKLKGIKIPFHSNFEEVNLRFYVTYNDNKVIKRGTVFIKEIVPKPAITLVANVIYGENYETLKMKHLITESDVSRYVEFNWKRKNWNSIAIDASKETFELEPNSVEEFIAEHYWGYNTGKNKKTFQYGIEHARWKLHKSINSKINVDFEDVYGLEFAFLKHQKPKSIFLIEGSEVIVREGQVCS
jgi:uncharacterized protein